MKIELTGCKLGPTLCASDDEIAKATFNLVMSDATPNMMGDSPETVVNRMRDARQYFTLDPTHIQSENIFFGASTMWMRQNYWDIFELTEFSVQFAEMQSVQKVPQWIPPSRSVNEREYVQLYLR